jgi:hypothetical protein
MCACGIELRPDSFRGVEQLGGDRQHGHVHDPRQAQGNEHVHPLEAQDAPALTVVQGRHAILGEGRMEVDHVRHHGRTDDPDPQVQSARAAQARDQSVQRVVRRGSDLQRFVEEAKEDDPE